MPAIRSPDGENEDAKIRGIERCIRANMTRAMSFVERAKDEPENAEEWMSRAYRADALANEWRLELRRYKERSA